MAEKITCNRSDRRSRAATQRRTLCLCLTLWLCSLAAPALAATAGGVHGPTLAEVALALDTVWVLLAGVLVFFMHAGFTALEAGFTRSKNSVNIIMKNVYTISAGVLVYYLIGFGLMFGHDRLGLVGGSAFGLAGWHSVDLDLPGQAFWFFQAVFAATAATVVSGAVAERIRFGAYALFVLLITGFIYPVVGHWIWGGGWLARLGMIDFAGSTVVHSVGAWSALVGAWLLGPRLGKFVHGRPRAIPGHSMPLGALGVLILFMGWFGFNAGSTLSARDAALGAIVVNTLLAGAAGTLAALCCSWLRQGKPDVGLTLNGTLAGLVAITAGAADLATAGALAVGALAGLLLVFAVGFIEQRLQIDDPVGAVSVHGVCGAFGTLMVGLFATEGGLFYGGGPGLLGVQALGVLAVAVFTLSFAYAAFRLVSAVAGLRVSEAEEASGLDLPEHGAAAYSDLGGAASLYPDRA